jgi:uncharacterized protein YjbJ (UPF0337 family)
MRRDEGGYVNWDIIKGNWTQLKGKAREQWGDLTDDEFDKVAGEKDQFVGMLQTKYGKSRDETERDVDHWADSLTDDDYRMRRAG